MARITVVIEGDACFAHIGQHLAGGNVVAVAAGDLFASVVIASSGLAAASDSSNCNPSAGHDSDLITMDEVCEIMGRTRSGVDKLRARDDSFPQPWKDGDQSRSRIYFSRRLIKQYLERRLANQ